MAIAALSLSLAGRVDEANEYKGKIRERVPNYAMADFLAAFRFSPETAALFKTAGPARRHQVADFGGNLPPPSVCD